MVPSGSVLAVKRSEIEAVVTIRGSKRLRLATPLPPEKFRALAPCPGLSNQGYGLAGNLRLAGFSKGALVAKQVGPLLCLLCGF